MDKEIRAYKMSSNAEGRIVSGYAVRFNEPSQYIGFYETIDKDAITQDVLDNSDIYMRFDHKEDNFLARSRFGEGSLKMELREDGIYFEFECPDTAFGNDVLTKIQRGECAGCSFAFTVAPEDDAQEWTMTEDNVYLRTIKKIDRLFDLSVVAEPAYLSTSVEVRNYQEYIDKLEKRNDEPEDEPNNEPEDPKPEDEPENKSNEEETDDPENTPEDGGDNEPNNTDGDNEVEDQPEDEENQKRNKNITHINMENYSILAEVRKAKENGSMNFTIENRTAGKTMTVNAGTDNEGGTVNGVPNLVQKEYAPLIDPLYPNSVLNKLGVRTFSGLPMGDVFIPVLGKGTCGWAKEVAKAMKSDNTVTGVTLKPHKIACYVDISNQVLAQDNIQFEEAVRRDMQNAIYDTIEATLFGAGAAVAGEKPAGLFNGATITTANTYGKICDLEATIEEHNYTGEFKYLMSPKAKSFVRQTAKSSKNTEGILENGTIDGTTVLSTSNVPANQFIYGAFDEIAVGFWGNIDVKIDDITQAVYGVTRLIMTCYVDFQKIREGGLVFGTVVAGE